MVKRTILLISHDKRFIESVMILPLSREYRVVVADNKVAALRLFPQAKPDILLIHEEFYDSDIGRITQADKKHIPTMLIVSNPEIANPVSAFHLNATDCITSDNIPNILGKRIKRCMTILAPEKPKIPLGDLSLYLSEDYQILFQSDERIMLLPSENKLLLLLCNKQGEICTKETMISALWGYKGPVYHFKQGSCQSNIDSLVYSLRKKIKKLKYIHIKNIKTVGYRLDIAESS